MKTVAVVPAAGVGRRMGELTRKQMLLLQGKPILDYTLKALSACDLIDGILLMAHPDDIHHLQSEQSIEKRFPKVVAILAGGRERQETVYMGLTYLHMQNPRPRWVVIHDAVRPFVTQSCLKNTIEAAYRWQAAIAAVSVTDTIKQADRSGEWIIGTPDRKTLWAAQTPQSFAFATVWEAYEKAKFNGIYGTDDASLVERTGVNIRIVKGDYDNIKITNPADLIMAESILAARGGSVF